MCAYGANKKQKRCNATQTETIHHSPKIASLLLTPHFFGRGEKMISRLYLKNLLSFKEVELEFAPGLVVLTGPSGAGKSVLMQAILAQFGLGSSDAKLCEVELKRPRGLHSDAYELEEHLALKSIRKERVAHYIDAQKISRKALRELFAPYVRYLSVRDRGGLESATLVGLLDASRSARESSYKKLLKEYRKRFRLFSQKRDELERILEEERELAERREFARFEIEKIDAIAPKEGEYEELLTIKQQLSRIDKIREAMERAAPIFDLEERIQELFALAGKDADYFSDAMNQLRADFEELENLSEELAEVEIEGVLERLEALSALIRRHGSVGEALEYREAKAKELEGYENIERDKSALLSFLELEERELSILAQRISRGRQEEAQRVAEALQHPLKKLRLPAVTFRFEASKMDRDGIDRIDLDLEGSGASTLSGGEFNRLRLALMSVTLEGTKGSEGVIFLDEIDANVSGDESIAIAELIEGLSRIYQVFAISHQPHLSARADQHILVRKEGDESRALSLESEERVREIARIVSGERADAEATAFARKLLNDRKKQARSQRC